MWKVVTSEVVFLGMKSSGLLWRLLVGDGLELKVVLENFKSGNKYKSAISSKKGLTASSFIALMTVIKSSLPKSKSSCIFLPKSPSGTRRSSLGVPSGFISDKKPSSMLIYKRFESDKLATRVRGTHE